MPATARIIRSRLRDVAVRLLPHLIEAMHRVAGSCLIAHVVRNRVRSTRHRRGKPRIREESPQKSPNVHQFLVIIRKPRIARDSVDRCKGPQQHILAKTRLRKLRELLRLIRVDEKSVGVRSLLLRCDGKVWPWLALDGNNSLREQVEDTLRFVL